MLYAMTAISSKLIALVLEMRDALVLTLSCKQMVEVDDLHEARNAASLMVSDESSELSRIDRLHSTGEAPEFLQLPSMRFFMRRNSREKKERTVLERRTAELKEKLYKISYRRHSAPPKGASTGQEDAGEPVYYGGALRTATGSPAVLSELPSPVLELVLAHISLKDLVSSAALVHTSWQSLVMDEHFWRRRLSGKLPQELVNHFRRWNSPWINQAARFFSRNLISNPDFYSQKMSVATGLGIGSRSSNCWRVQFSCWQTHNVQRLPHQPEQDLHTLSLPGLRVLSLVTPGWGTPEAVQKIDLLDSLVSQGMTAATAAAFLDTCPPLAFSVWCYAGAQPSSWSRGYAVCALDDGTVLGAEWQGLREGSRLSMTNSLAHYISWAPEDSLLRGCSMTPSQTRLTSRGPFRRLACTFQAYSKGVRRVHIILKGLSPQQSPSFGRQLAKGSSEQQETSAKPFTEFLAPCFRFAMPNA